MFIVYQSFVKIFVGGPRGRVVKVADFSALNHSIISPLWVRAPSVLLETLQKWTNTLVSLNITQCEIGACEGCKWYFGKVLYFQEIRPIDMNRLFLFKPVY